MIKKVTGIELLKKNFDQIEEKHIAFFKSGPARWPSEQHDHIRNHYQNIGHLVPETVSWERLQVDGLPDDILADMHAAFDAFKRNEEYVNGL